MSDLARNFEFASKTAAEKGYVIRLPKGNELFIDIDDEESLKRFYKAYEVLQEHNPGCFYVCTHSPSGQDGRFHIVVTLPEIYGDFQRIALQAALGSDPKREILSFLRCERGEEKPILFFEKSDFEGDGVYVQEAKKPEADPFGSFEQVEF